MVTRLHNPRMELKKQAEVVAEKLKTMI